MRKTFTAATTCLALLCSAPHQGFSVAPELAKEIVQNAQNSNSEAILDQIAQLEKELEASDDLLAECRAFLRALVDEMNTQQGTALTLQQVCQSVRENLDAFQIPEENRAEFLEALDLLEAEDSPEYRHRANAWNFFQNGKKEQKSERGSTFVYTLLCAGALNVLTAAQNEI